MAAVRGAANKKLAETGGFGEFEGAGFRISLPPVS
jgi:hypothetical protein